MLNASHAGVFPRSGDGETIEVLHQLPPLSADALAEAGASQTQPLDVQVRPGHTLVQRVEPARPTRPTRRRRRTLLAALGIAAVAAIAVPVTVALTTGDGGSPPPRRSSTPTSGSPSPNASSGATQGSVVSGRVRIGDLCTFVDEGNRVASTSGATAVCVRRIDGSYIWEKA